MHQLGHAPRVDRRRDELDVRQLALRDHHVTLAWLYLRRNERFYGVRDMFMVAMGIALVGYMVFPTAPPRFMPELGFTDPVAALTARRRSAYALVNPYAAVPSMHVAFALMLAVPMVADRPPHLGPRAVVRLSRGRHLRRRRDRQPLVVRRLPGSWRRRAAVAALAAYRGGLGVAAAWPRLLPSGRRRERGVYASSSRVRTG